MPQDSLWATSARVTGWRATLDLDADPDGQDVLMFRPVWSKTPGHGRDGGIVEPVPSYMRDYVPGIIRAAHVQLVGGDAKHVPAVVRAEIRRIRDAFLEGAIH